MMLSLISLGIWDEKDLSLRAVETAKSCSIVYLEKYTANTGVTARSLEKILGKKVVEISRPALEEKSKSILQEAQKTDVAVLVPGDCLFATTHLSLIFDCRRKKIPFKIIHGSSILTAAGEAGLSLYKFGEVVSIPRWQKNFQPVGFYEKILRNKKRGLHTLALLDIGMKPEEAIAIIKKIEKKPRLLKEKIICLEKAGSEEQKIYYSDARKIRGTSPAILIFPGKLNEFEKEFLESV